jgi:tRNA (cmo5U34)-methyltransferase
MRPGSERDPSPAGDRRTIEGKSEVAARARIPEPMVMLEPDAAAAFDRAGREEGPLVPLYELCARCTSNLLPHEGTIMDLGSASGRYLAYVAERRPDAQIVGVELSEPMLALGERRLAEEGLENRVRLIQGDMTDCSHLAPADLDLLGCMLALHQLPSVVELSGALRQVAEIRDRTGCAIWIADIVRLEDDTVMKEWLSLTPDLDPLFSEDALASEAAGWTHAELTAALRDAGLGDLHHSVSPLLQVHWSPSRDVHAPAKSADWREIAMSGDLRQRVLALRLGLRDLP